MRYKVIKFIASVFHNFEIKLQRMEQLELYYNLKNDTYAIKNELIKLFDDVEVNEITKNDVILIQYGHTIGIEINVFLDNAVITTYHLTRDTKIFNQYNKKEIGSFATIYVNFDDNGQIKCNFKANSIKYPSSEFIKSYLKFYYKAVIDYFEKAE